MNILKILMTALLVSLCCACGSDDGVGVDAQAVTHSIAYSVDTTMSQGCPDTLFAESWLISNATMSISRIGGLQIEAGSWEINLTVDEIAAINSHLAQILDSGVKDRVVDYVVEDAGATQDLYVGKIKEFHYGNVVTDPITYKSEWHEFPAEVIDFVGYLEQVMTAHIGDRYID